MKNTYRYDLVQKMSFVRWGGTEEELKAAKLLLGEIESFGGKGEIKDFEIPANKLIKTSIKVVAPYEAEIADFLPFTISGSFPEGGVELELFYAENCSETALYGIKDLSGKAVLVNELNIDIYKKLCELKAGAILVIHGKWYQSGENWDFLPRALRPTFLEFGKIPTFYVWAKDATEMVKNGAEKLHIELVQEEYTATSRNVLAVIEGSEIKDESIVITAHYDSVQVGTGSWDNATGSATIMSIYKHFLANPPKRTLRFVWCGSEEQGLYGSKAYVEQNEELVKNEIKFCFNFDMCGTVLGPNNVFVTGGEELKNYAEAFCKEYGMNAEIRHGVHSSDSAPFADKGVPSLGLSRGSKTADIHTRYDLMFPLSAEQLVKDGEFAIAFIDRVANSYRLPVGTGMPKDMVEKIDKYFARDKMPKK